MATNWKQAAQGPGKMPAGYHRLKVTGVQTTDKDGRELQSKDGHPAINVLVRNNEGETGRIRVTLSQNGAWVLASLLESAGADLDRMTTEGVEVQDFASQDFASKQLIGRVFWGNCEHKGEYANIRPVLESEVPQSELARAASYTAAPAPTSRQPAPATTAAPGQHAPLDDSDIPFNHGAFDL